jgi:arginine-tRNA-protein transferase
MRWTPEEIEQRFALDELPQACPYLPNQVATLRFLDGWLAAGIYRELLDKGYRRSGTYFYRPNCPQCRACRILRVPVARFEMSKEQRRIWRRNSACLHVRLAQPSFSWEKVHLYSDYLAHQHHATVSDVPEREYKRFLVETCLGGHTIEVQYLLNERLVGVGIVDCVGDALSSVYFYYAREARSLRLGTFSALWEIDLARSWGLQYYYLGYYIADCRAMSYKIRFKPCETKDIGDSKWTCHTRKNGEVIPTEDSTASLRS